MSHRDDINTLKDARIIILRLANAAKDKADREEAECLYTIDNDLARVIAEIETEVRP